MVKDGKPIPEQQSEVKNDRRSETDFEKKILISTEVMTAKGEWVDIAFETSNSLKIYRTVLKDDISDSKNIYLVNSLKKPTRTQSTLPNRIGIARVSQSDSEKDSESSSTQGQSSGGSSASSSGTSYTGTSSTGGSTSGGGGYS